MLWLVVTTVLAAGSLGYDRVRQVDQTLRCSVAECEEEVAALQVAATKAQQTFDDAMAQLKEDKQGVLNKIDNLQKLEQEQRDRILAITREHRETFRKYNQTESFDGWRPEDDPDKRNELFIQVCEQFSAWNKERCTKVLKDARVTKSTGTHLTQLSHAEWHKRVAAALDVTCENLLGQVQNVFRYCNTNRDLVRVELPVIYGLLQAADLYAESNDRASALKTQVTAQQAQLEQLDADESIEEYVLTDVQSQLAKAEALLREAKSDPWRRVVAWRDAFWSFISPFALGAVGLLLLNFLWRPIAYFVLAPMIRYTGHLRLLPENASTDAVQIDDRVVESHSTTPEPSSLQAHAGTRQLNVRLQPEEQLWVRPEYVTSSRDGGSTWIYGGLKHPFTSYAAGLTGLTHFIGSKRSKVTLGGTGGEHTDEYIGSISLTTHPGFAIRPRHIIAIQGDLKIRFRWSFKMMSLLRGQLRHAVLSGTGVVYVVGNGGVFPQVVGDPDVGREHAQPSDQLKDVLIVGWDARVQVSLRRNENWIHVALLRRDAMFETALLGEGVYVQTHSTPARRNDFVGRLFEGVLSAIGKLLGI